MDASAHLTPILRMLERFLIVAGGILSIYLGYRLFVLGIDKSQGQASALGVELKNFGPGLFFAALGAVVLVTTMRAAIRVGDADQPQAGQETQQAGIPDTTPRPPAAVSGTPVFFGLEDTERTPGRWASTAFYLETRQLLRRIDAGEAVEKLADLRASLEAKLESIAMTAKEYERYQALTAKVPLSQEEQRELLVLEKKLAP